MPRWAPTCDGENGLMSSDSNDNDMKFVDFCNFHHFTIGGISFDHRAIRLAEPQVILWMNPTRKTRTDGEKLSKKGGFMENEGFYHRQAKHLYRCQKWCYWDEGISGPYCTSLKLLEYRQEELSKKQFASAASRGDLSRTFFEKFSTMLSQ